MNYEETILNLMKQVKRSHFLIIIISGISLSICLEFLTPTKLNKELNTIYKIENDLTKSLIKYREDYLLSKIDSLENQLLELVNENAFYWNKKRYLESIFLEKIQSPPFDINESSIEQYKNWLTQKKIITLLPDKIWNCSIIDKLKEGYIRIDNPTIQKFIIKKLDESDTAQITVTLYDKFRAPKSIYSDGKFISSRELTCNCSIIKDSVAIFTNYDFVNNFPELNKNYSKYKNENLRERISLTYYESKQELLDKKTKVLDVEIGLRFLAIAVNICLLGLLVYLNSYLIGFFYLIKKLEILSEKVDYLPFYWVGLMDNVFSRIFFIISLIIFPLFSCGLTSYIYFENLIFPISSISISFFLVSYSYYLRIEIINKIKLINKEN